MKYLFLLFLPLFSCAQNNCSCLVSYPTIDCVVDSLRQGINNYNAFPSPQKLSDGSIISIFKRSDSHPSSGPSIIVRSTNGGITWTQRQITVNHTLLNVPVVIMKKGNSKISIAYQHSYDSVHFAYVDELSIINNFSSFDFTDGTKLSYLANYSSSPYGQIQILPSGKLLQPYYSIGTGPNINKCKVGLLESSNDGVTWSLGSTIYTENTPNAFNGELVSETFVLITEMGTSDSNTKLVAYGRNETHDFYSHGRSSDGGITWTFDTINFFYKFGVQVAKSPLSLSLHNGVVYIIDGVRNVTGTFTLQYTTCTPSNCFNNNQSGYSANVILPYVANATVNGAAIDWGYPMPFIDKNDQLWIHFYDTTPYATLANKAVMVYQTKVHN